MQELNEIVDSIPSDEDEDAEPVRISAADHSTTKHDRVNRTQDDPVELARMRDLAGQMGFITEHDHLLLTGWTAETAKTKRKRGEGPAYVRLGLNNFYPLDAYAAYMRKRVRTPSAADHSGGL